MTGRVSVRRYDVVVLGGGMAGFAAARRCAQARLSTMLIERRPVLGWESTWAFQLDVGDHESESASSVVAAVGRAGGARAGRLDAPILEMVLDRELARSGAELLYYSQPVAVTVNEDRILEVVVAGKSGEIRIGGRMFVDATDNALVWRMTGGSGQAGSTRSQSWVFINGLDDVPAPSDSDGITGLDGVRIEAGVWPGELAVGFEVDASDSITPVRRLPAVLATIRDALPSIGEGVVTHVSVEPFPLEIDGTSGLVADGRHPQIGNLFRAGLSAGPPGTSWTIGSALAVGERVGGEVVERVRGDHDRRPNPSDIEPLYVSLPDSEGEVLVCGGGTGGTLAAIAASREGAAVTLLEASPLLGGVGAGGGIHIYYHGLTGGLQDELDDRMRSVQSLFGPPQRVRGFHPVVRRVILAEMLAEGRVTVVPNATVSDVLTVRSTPPSAGQPARDIVRGVVAATPNGRAVFRARAVVDATGDADVAVMAGQPATFGREKDGLPHAYSQGAGRFDHERNYVLMMTNFDAGYCDPGDIEDLTRARRAGLEHIWRDRFEADDRKLYIAPHLGVRSSRQIVGETRITMTDLIDGRRFDDVISYARAHLDNHADDYESESDEATVWMWLLGYHWRLIGCEVPYRALLPTTLDGLIIGCRALSLSHDAHTTIRMQRDIQRIGEAAGIAAAISARAGVSLRDVPIQDLQIRLLASGALGDRDRADLLASDFDEAIHLTGQLGPAFPDRTIEDWVATLDGTDPREAVWPLYRAGRDAVPLLVEAARESDPDVAFWASVVLAMLGEADGVPRLAQAVRERRDDRVEAVKTAPAWWTAIALLGRTGSGDAVAALVDVVDDTATEHDALVAALRALGRIGDPAAAPAIGRLLLRDDLPVRRMLQVSHVPMRTQTKLRAPGVVEDARWAIELAAAEALSRLGVPQADVVEPYLGDPRAYVRRYAERVAGTPINPAPADAGTSPGGPMPRGKVVLPTVREGVSVQ